MKGYWNRPDATSAVLKDGWLHTGDLGYFDSGGNLFITGREKDVIVLSNGKNVYPEEIEAYYLKSPYIKEIGVMALESEPGNPASDRLYAVVVPDFDLLKERKIVNAKEVIRFDIEGISAKIASTKRIGSYEIWQDPLPRTTTRKLKRFEMEKRVRGNQKKGQPDFEARSAPSLSVEDAQWLEQPEVQQALKIIRESSANAPEVIRPSDNLELDLGLDSMQRIELLVAVEKELGGDVEESAMAEIYTVRQLVDAIRESADGRKDACRVQASKRPAGNRSCRKNRPILRSLPWPGPGESRNTSCTPHSSRSRFLPTTGFICELSGLEKLPAQGPYIISSNHQSYLDPILLASVLPWRVFRNLFAVGTSEIFGSGFMRRLARWMRVIVVDPDANLVSAMRAGAFGLRHGRILILYPEGERSINGMPRVFKKGAAILSIHLQVPIVPVAIEGFHDAWPRGQHFQKFVPLQIQIGDPIYPPSESGTTESAYAELTAELKARVVGMWEGLRGDQKTAAGTQTPHS